MGRTQRNKLPKKLLYPVRVEDEEESSKLALYLVQNTLFQLVYGSTLLKVALEKMCR